MMGPVDSSLVFNHVPLAGEPFTVAFAFWLRTRIRITRLTIDQKTMNFTAMAMKSCSVSKRLHITGFFRAGKRAIVLGYVSPVSSQ